MRTANTPAGAAQAAGNASEAGTAPAGPQKKAVFSTGVAKGRDLLDSAVSTSMLDEDQIQQSGARSLAELLRRVPGFRVEDFGDGSNANYTIRGLPLSGAGSKWLQFQEDGLPVLEFGDINFNPNDMLIRPDFNLARIESIRGGSASTFASNSPGGIINFLSKTGEEEGGSIGLSTGLDYGSRRVDFDYGGRLSSNLRFHVGGFYRSGTSPRDAGFNSSRGGQVKLNVTREFANGYIRFYAKLLDERQPVYTQGPLRVSGTNADPSFSTLPNFDLRHDRIVSNYTRSLTGVDVNGNLFRADMADGMHPVSKALGLEAKFDLASWTFVNRMRYSDTSSNQTYVQPLSVSTAPGIAAAFGGAGANLFYGTGPQAGQAIVDPTTLAGNGIAALSAFGNARTENLNYFVNDLRASRVWKAGGGDLTLTAGVYKSQQTIKLQLTPNTVLQDFAGKDTVLLDLQTAAGTLLTQKGVYSFSLFPVTASANRYIDVDYDITAPYGSLNFHKGRLSIGGSLRYDSGNVNGVRYGAEMGGGRPRYRAIDVNGDGVISPAERNTGILATDQPAPVSYDYHYVSYSAGINFRVSDSFAVFGRYSRGARALADRILTSPIVDPVTGKPASSNIAYNPVRQAEAGVKYRTDALMLNLTGFFAKTAEQNYQVVTGANGVLVITPFTRDYSAYGAEFEGSYQIGAFNLMGSATYTHAEIKKDSTNAALNGNTPRHQPKLILQAMPSVTFGSVSAGAAALYTGSSYAQDSNLLKMPAYTTVNAFVQFRPIDRLELMVTGSNLFDTLGLVDIGQASIPASGIVTARAINGRTLQASARFHF